jgi:hypothetical protein
MTGPQEDTHESLPNRLNELFEAIQTVRPAPTEEGAEPAGHDAVLQMMHEHIRPVLMAETDAARPSHAATWHLAHLAVALLGQAEVPEGEAYSQLHSARRQLDDALARTELRQRYESAEALGWIVERLAAALSEHLIVDLPVPLATQLATDLPVPLATQLATDLPVPLATQLATVLPVPLATQLATVLPVPLAGPLSDQLVLSLPGPIAQAVVAAQDKVADEIAALQALAATSLNTAIKSPADAIHFLQQIRDRLNAIENDAKQVPPELIQPITTVVLDAIAFVAQTASTDDVATMNGLKQDIAAIHPPPARTQPARTQPARTQPARTQPARTQPALSGGI